MFTTLTLDPRGTTLVVRFDNPATELATGGLFEDLDRMGRLLARDRHIRSVVLAGPREGVWLPHFDLAEIAEGAEELGVPTPYPLGRIAVLKISVLMHVPGMREILGRTPLSGLVTLALTHRALDRLSLLPQVVIAAIGGDAMGGGCEVALASDLRVMARGPFLFGLPELTAGIPPGAGGSVRLTRALGPARASAMILRSRALSPDEALGVGLVDEVVAPGELMPRALDLADELATRNPAAVRAAKRAIRSAAGASLGRSLQVESAGFVATASARPAIDRLNEFVAASSGNETPWRDRSWLPRPSG